MAVIEYDEYKQKLQALEPTLGELEKALGIPKAREELAELQKETEQEGFWNDLERSQQVSRQVKRLENKIKKHDKLVSEWEDTLTLCEMAQEEDDPSQLEEVVSGYETLEKEISERRLAALLSGEYDANNAILTFHAGAGGTEAQDWTEMLYRMYTRWAERHGYTYQLMDYEAGDEAGIKSATILIEGENAYGYLKSENGVHRLVRVSPFDANARRQTSFAALEVMPELDDDSEIENPAGGHRNAGLPQLRRRRPAHQQDVLRRASDPPSHGHRGVLPDRAQPVPEPGQRHEDAAGKAGRAEAAAARGEDQRSEGRADEDRVGQPDPFLCIHALHSGQGHPHRL